MLSTIKKIVAEMDEYPLTKDTKIGLFGAGYFAPFINAYLKKSGYSVTCCMDNFKTGMMDDIPILNSTDEAVSQLDIIFITTVPFAEAISRQLTAEPNTCHIPHVLWDKYFIKQNLDAYLTVRELFHDDKSKNILDRLLIKGLTADPDYTDICEERQYFSILPFIIGHNETFLNAGAACGDTVESFINIHSGNFNKILAFEPSKRSFQAMQKRMARLIDEWGIDNDKIILINSALAEENGIDYLLKDIMFAHRLITDQYSYCNVEKVTTTTIDDVCKDQAMTLLAADIEGYELPMLRGGLATIRRDRPKLAISVYHRPDDLFEILSFCKAVHADYKFSLRQHDYSIGDVVLYCY